METTNKIQCPSCGATSSYTETSPGQYKCGYCLSGWEQSTVLPDKNKEQEFFKKCEEIFNLQIKLTRERPKYFERSFGNISVFYTFLLEIETPEYKETLLPKFFTLTEKQIAEYAKEDIDENVDRDKIFLNYPDKFVLIVYLAELEYMMAKIIALNYGKNEKLEEALQKLKTAQKLHGSSIDEWQPKISKAVVGILQRLGDQNRTFEYLHALAADQSLDAFKTYYEKSSGFEPDGDTLAGFLKNREEYKEEISYLFEDIIFSDAYQAWETENAPQTEAIQAEEEALLKADKEETNTDENQLPEKKAEKPKKRSFWQKMLGKDSN